jgi:hypothetical protein
MVLGESTLVAECHIMLEKLMAAAGEFNAAKDNVLLAFGNKDSSKFE